MTVTSRDRAANADIRMWAKAKGVDLAERGRIPAEVRNQYNEANGVPIEGQAPEVDAPVSLPVGETLEEMAEPSPHPETPPRPPERNRTIPDGPGRRIGEKVRGWVTGNVPAPETPRPAPGRKRMSLENLVEAAWDGIGGLLRKNQVAYPIGNVLKMQAPVAGVIAEDALAGTVADRVLQPLARLEASKDTAMALLGPPLLTAMIVRDPRLYEPLFPYLRKAMLLWLQIAGPKIKAKQRQEERLMADFKEEFGDDFDLDDLVENLFKPPDWLMEAAAAAQAPEPA